MSKPHTYRLRWVLWLVVSLVVLISLPGMMSANYLPKTFWAALTIGIGFILLPPRDPRHLSITPLGSIWLVYLFWALFSALWALSPRVSFERWLALLLPAFAYLLAKRTRFWESDKFWLWFSLLAGVVALIGILQYFFPSLPLVNSFPGTKIPRATLGHRNYAGMYFMLVLPFLGWSYFHLPGKKNIAPLAGFFLAVVFVLITRNRGAWLGIIFGLVFVLTANFHQIRCFVVSKNRQDPENSKRKYGNKIILLVTFLYVSIASVLLFSPHEKFPKGKYTIFQTSTNLLHGKGRIQYWESCLGITNPAIGGGLGNFPIVMTPTLKSGQVKTLNYEVHNDYLQAYLDLGLPGLLIFASIFGYLLYLAWIGRNQGIILAAGAAVTGLIVMQFTTFTSEKVSSQIWLAGLAAILNSQNYVRPFLRKRMPQWSVLTGNYLMALYLFIFAAIVGYTIRGDRAFRKAQNIVLRTLEYEKWITDPKEISGRELAVLRHQLPFIRADTLNRLHWLADRILPTMFFDANMKHITCFQFAGYAMKLKDYDDAAVLAQEAFSMHPTDRVNLKRLCQIALKQEQYNQAIQLLNKGIEIFGYNPSHPFFYNNLIRIYEALGKNDLSRKVKDRMMDNIIFRPVNPSPKNMAKDVGVRPVFEWQGSPGALYYNFYIWENRRQRPNKPLFHHLRENKLIFPYELKSGTIYLWEVEAIGHYHVENNLWYFKTVSKSLSD